MSDHPHERVCTRTGLALVPASGEPGWRVAKDRYVNRDGVTGARVNETVGPLQPGAEDSRCRYDTAGRTVYFGDSEKVSLAESLLSFRQKLLSTEKDAAAIGVGPRVYLRRITEELHERGLPAPGEIPVEWQMAHSVWQVRMPERGWWVRIDSPRTLNSLSSMLGGSAGQLSLGDVCGDDRGLTTTIAQAVRDVILDDGELPLGITYPSKLGYGQCRAWWNRRADDDLPLVKNDPQPVDSTNVCIPALDELLHEWGLTLTGRGR